MTISENTIIKPSWWAQVFGEATGYQAAEIRREGIRIKAPAGSFTLSFKQISTIEQETGTFWDSIRLSLPSEKKVVMKGIPKQKSQSLKILIQQRYQEYFKSVDLLQEHGSTATALSRWLDRGMRGEHWVAHHQVTSARANAALLGPALGIEPKHLTQDADIKRAAIKVQIFAEDPEGFRAQANERFVEAELPRFQKYFDTVESNPLTESQRLAILSHEDNTRVIAGAGSGKTSVIIAKAGYLLKKGLCTPEQLLLVAFNRSAADEMAERIHARIGIEVRATTFHALGLSIVGEVTGKKPTLAKSAEDSVSLLRDIQNIVTELLKNRKTTEAVRTYFQSFFAPYKSERDFRELGDYYAYAKAQGFRTIKGEQVKSYEEAEIANFLFLNGVAYEYERSYEVDLADVTHRQYQPDFYLTDYGIYVEHFGIDRDGSTAPYIDRIKYAEQMEWKRQVHQDNGTMLIETYSYMKQEGNLTSEVERLLRNAGVELQPIPSEKILEQLKKGQQLDPFSTLIATFLNHFKGNGYTVAGVLNRAEERQLLTPRLEAFLHVFEPLYERYEAGLREARAIDFNDMIVQAIGYAESGRYQSPYTCLLVDEFQDISAGRARLVKALANQAPSHRLFCVGDDWQAIYRFAGSDIALMRDFEEHFGFTETMYLDQTFRFNDRIEYVATRFILENPAQIAKTIITRHKAKEPRVIVHRPQGKGEDVLVAALEEIQHRAGPGQYTVLLLGRYNSLEDGLAWSDIHTRFPRMEMNFRTVHSAKGLEADYVVIVGLQSGKYGFPSEIADDPILDVVLSKPENFSHAEERRLFYVALTRARHAVHLIADYAAPSSFLAEILSYEGDVEERGGAAAIEPVNCDECKTGNMVQRTGPYGTFYSCSNFPLCACRTDACKRCGTGILARQKNSRCRPRRAKAKAGSPRKTSARACDRSGEGAAGPRSRRRSYAKRNPTRRLVICGRCGAPLCGASLRPQDVRGTKKVVAIARVPAAQDAPGGIHEG